MVLLDALKEVRREIATAGTDINEADAKAAFIAPVLVELGWRGLQRIRSEYAVDQGRMRLDYALIGSRAKPVALIEAKAPREDLESHVAQVLNYAFHEGVDICVLTTGVLWWFYLPRERGNPAERRFAELDLRANDLEEAAATLASCLEHEALTSGTGEKRAKELLFARQLQQQVRSEIPRAWQRLLAGPNEILIELVQEEVQDALGARPSDEQVKEELRKFFQHQRTPVGTDPPRANLRPVSVSPEPVTSPSRSRRGRKSPKTHVKEFRLWGQTYPVRHQYEVLANAADLVYLRHPDDFGRALRLGRFHARSDDCIKPHQIGNSGVFVDCNLSFPDMKRTCERLLETFGYSAQDLEIVTEA